MMTFEERKELVKSYLGKLVNIKVDRPIGYIHEKGDCSITYPINYGYIPDVIGGDGEELDAYVLGVEEAIDECTARIIAIIHRENDVEDKLVAVTDVFLPITKEVIEKAVSFQEQYYDTYIEMLDIRYYECAAQNCRVNDLPDKIAEACENGVVLKTGNHIFELFTWDAFQKVLKKMRSVKLSHDIISSFLNRTENINGERGLFLAVFHAYKKDNPELSPDTIFHLQIITYRDTKMIRVIKAE